MASSAARREKIFKSWEGISEVALIKEVATKGEHIQLCIEYWADKHKMPKKEYADLFFHDVVQSYVQRLLSERLVCKAENVLRNVQRDVRCFYYQFACESDDPELRELLLDYLRQRDPHDFAQYMQEMQFQWDLLQQLQACPVVLDRLRPKLRRIQLEELVSRDAAFHNRLIAALYASNRNAALLPRLNKFAFWDFLVESQQAADIIRWCHLSELAPPPESVGRECSSELELKFAAWPVEAKMYEYALKTLVQPGEVLRNCFARAGYFFADELSNDAEAVVLRRLRRICTTESFACNREILEKLQLGSYLLQHSDYYPLTLQSAVAVRELEELAEQNSSHSEMIKLVVTLKDNDLRERAGFEKVAQVAKTYLESRDVDFQTDQPLVTFYEFLCNEPSIASLHCFLMSSALKHIPYLKSLAHRLETSNSIGGAGNGNAARSKLPNPYDLLCKFKGIDFVKLSQRMQPSSASFSDERLCEQYARKYTVSCTHYLKQQRSAYAVYFLLTEHLQHYAQITRTQLFSACEAVTELALQHATNADLVTHCVAFCEMLGFDTQQLRCFLKLSRDTLPGRCAASIAQLVELVEVELAQRLQTQSDATFPLAEYQALLQMVAYQPEQQRQWPLLILRHYARADDWWSVLVLLQYFEMPLTVLRELCDHFGTRALGRHLLRALSNDPPPLAKRHSSISRQQKMMSRKAEMNLQQSTTSAETMTSSISSCHDLSSSNSAQLCFIMDTITAGGNLDLFAIILLSAGCMAEERLACARKLLEIMTPPPAQENNSNAASTVATATSWNLMRNCIKYQRPVLALLAATVSPLNADWCWIVWLAAATDQWSAVLQDLANGDMQELQWRLISNSVLHGRTALLYRSFCLFFENNPLVHLFRCLHLTQNCHNFGDEVVLELRRYLLAWSNNEVALPLGAPIPREQLMLASIRLLLVHLQHGFNSTLEQHKFIGCICRSDMSDISGLIDFCLLNDVFAIMQSAATLTGRATTTTTETETEHFPINFEKLLVNEQAEYSSVLDALLAAKQYDVAVRLASLLHMPIADIVYKKWVAGLDAPDGVQHQLESERYEDEVVEHSLPPEILVDFFLYAAATRLGEDWTQLYVLYKRALDVIKRHHLLANESFDRDHIECLMILSYLKIEDADAAAALPIYHSEYFEQIMLNERCVLYKSFLELKELAGIEELNVGRRSVLTGPMQRRLEALLNRLLDVGDIVEALRLQELFECRPIDLRFVVFCMALAEGVTTLVSMSSEERQLLRSIEKSSFAKFNRRTLGTLRSSFNQSDTTCPSPLKSVNDSVGGGGEGGDGGNISDSSSTTMEFEEIPSKEKRETLDIIQGVASKLRYGVDIGRRIVMSYRAAMYLDKEYLDVLRTKDVSVLLKSVAEEECLHRLLVVSDILTSTRTTPQEIADMLAFEIARAVVRPRFYIFSAADDHQARNTFKNADLWGYNIDRELHLFLELAPSTTKLGARLLDYCDALKAYRKFQDNKPFEHSAAFERLAEIIARYGLPLPAAGGSGGSGGATPPLPQVLSHKKQNLIYVELLIKAHQCFVHECSMEGIANILHRTKSLNAQLTASKSWALIVRLLIGIARYREMFYCFDALIDNDQFESLLAQVEDDKTRQGLRQAILAYLREYRPDNNREFLNLAALHFLMYKELAEMWEQDARDAIANVLQLALVSSGQLSEQSSMTSALGGKSARIQIPRLRSSPTHVSLLQQALVYYTHATENYLLDNKLLLAQKSVSMAELVAMQIDLANSALGKGAATTTTMTSATSGTTVVMAPTTPAHSCVCVLTVRKRDEFRELVNAELSVSQALILSRAYGYDINWTEALLSQYVILKRAAYLDQYLAYRPINDSIIDNIIKSFQLYAQHHKTSAPMEEHLARLVGLVKSITLKYKLASVLSLKATLTSLINEQTSYYLRDTNYGRSEERNMPDVC